MPIETDFEFEQKVISSVEPHGGGWTIGSDGGCLCIPKYSAEPKVGDPVLFYGRGFGYVVRGVVINGVTVYYRTPEEQEARRLQEKLDHDAKKQQELDESQSDRNARRSALPVEFQRRLDGLQARAENWRRDMEPYELFVCEQAVIIANEFDVTGAAYDEPRELLYRGVFEVFRSMSWSEQKDRVPDLSEDRSGNTFGAAVFLAQMWLTAPDLVEKAHAAICPLLGCCTAGCWVMSQPLADQPDFSLQRSEP